MNVYLYIAENNPDEAYEICKKYGYFNINSMEELADALKSIVAEQGQDSLEEILNIFEEYRDWVRLHFLFHIYNKNIKWLI